MNKTSFIFVILFTSVVLLFACDSDSDSSSSSSTTNTNNTSNTNNTNNTNNATGTVIHTSKNIYSIALGDSDSIDVEAVNSSETALTFTATSSSTTCVTVSASTDSISITGGSAICEATVTLTASDNTTKTLTIKVFDEMVMDIGDGLLIKFTNKYTWRYNDDENNADNYIGAFWQPNLSEDTTHKYTNDGWYAVGSYFQGLPSSSDYNNLISTNHPMVLIKDSKNAGLLAAPTSYTQRWHNHGSGGMYDGAVWKPVCPTGFVALGDVTGVEDDTPDTKAMRCIDESYTVEGSIGSRVYDNYGGWDDTELSIYQIVSPSSVTKPVDEDRMVLPAGTFVGCTSYDVNTCDTDTVHVLLIPVPVVEKSENVYEPKLTDYQPFEGDPNRPKFFSRVRLPFTLIPSLYPEVDTSVGGSVTIDYLVNNSPFCYLQRQETYKSLNVADNRQNSETGTLSYSMTESFSQTDTDTFSQKVGLKITVGGEASLFGSGGEWKVELSTEFQWTQSTATTFGTSTTTSSSFTVPAGVYAQVIQVITQFQAVLVNGSAVGAPMAGGQNTVKYLQYPLAE